MNRPMRTIITAAILTAGTALAQPSLAPPDGNIASSQRFGLRTAINAENTPGDDNSVFRITQPGSYYLPRNLRIDDLPGLPGKTVAIEVASSDVTIDLNGFTISRGTVSIPLVAEEEADDGSDPNSVSAPDETVAISTEGNTVSGLHIRGGIVRGFHYGVRSSFGTGRGTHSSVRLLDIESTGADAIGLFLAEDWTVEDCRIRSDGQGILSSSITSTIRRCDITSEGLGISGGGLMQLVPTNLHAGPYRGWVEW
ncbi:MAG: hypothetical protein AAFR38_05625 [Planctomycetota bacterium]